MSSLGRALPPLRTAVATQAPLFLESTGTAALTGFRHGLRPRLIHLRRSDPILTAPLPARMGSLLLMAANQGSQIVLDVAIKAGLSPVLPIAT